MVGAKCVVAMEIGSPCGNHNAFRIIQILKLIVKSLLLAVELAIVNDWQEANMPLAFLWTAHLPGRSISTMWYAVHFNQPLLVTGLIVHVRVGH